MTAVEFLGEEFELPGKINHLRLLRLAKYASAGADSGSMKAMGALDDLITQCIRPEDMERFEALTDKEGADTTQLFEFTAKVIGELGERPTERPAVSSVGPSSTPESGVSRLEAVASERFSGRPDLMIAATRSA